MDSFDDAFPELFRRARGLAYRILGDVTAAEDAAAEAMARALVHWHRVGSLPYRDAWVLRVTTNVALDAGRRRARAHIEPVPTEEPTDSHEELVVLRAALVAALGSLPRRQREAIVLIHLVGLSPSDAAAAMHVSVSSVGQHVRRGLTRLRDQAPDGLEPLDLESEIR